MSSQKVLVVEISSANGVYVYRLDKDKDKLFEFLVDSVDAEVEYEDLESGNSTVTVRTIDKQVFDQLSIEE